MKKFILLLTITVSVLLNTSVFVCADNNFADFVDFDNVESMFILTSQVNDGATSALQKSVTNTHDIERIIYMLNHISLTEIDKSDMSSGAGAYFDLQINVQYENGKTYIISFPNMGGHQYAVVSEYDLYYETTYQEINRLNEFCRAAALQQTNSTSEHITYTPSDWAASYVNTAITDGLVPEWNQADYTEDIPRVEVCQLIDNLLSINNIEIAGKGNPFFDTHDTAVSTLYNLGIVSGKTDTEFCPYDTVTREEFAKILNNTCDVLGIETSAAELTYADAADISDWAAEPIARMFKAGLMRGDDDNEFKPLASITKEEAITAILRMAHMGE